jgi:uncharacterized membrane protein
VATLENGARAAREAARLETFSDGVFAIAITLLAVEIHPPEDLSNLTRALLDLWPSYVAYAISFTSIGLFWMHHHYALGFFGRVDWTFMGLNTLMLALHRLHPLPDGRARGHVRAGEVRGTATLFYAATFFVTGVVTNIAWRYAASGRRLIEGRPGRGQRADGDLEDLPRRPDRV